jgi:hypothetical protein
MDSLRLGSFLDHLPDGLSEIYSHPATRHWEERPMPADYQVEEEYRALIDPANRERVARRGLRLTSFAREATDAASRS